MKHAGTEEMIFEVKSNNYFKKKKKILCLHFRHFKELCFGFVALIFVQYLNYFAFNFVQVHIDDKYE